MVCRTATGTWEVTSPIFTMAGDMLTNDQFMWVGIWGHNPSVRCNGIPIARAVA